MRMQEHRNDPKRSKLKRLCPSIGAIFTDLPLLSAFHEFDSFFALSRRRFVLPNFAEIRCVPQHAQENTHVRALLQRHLKIALSG